MKPVNVGEPVLQGDVFDPVLPLASFDGTTYEAEHDYVRLTGQNHQVFALMKDGRWRTLAEIELATRFGQASISARLRDLRKKKFGGWLVERRRRGIPSAGLFEYRIGGKR